MTTLPIPIDEATAAAYEAAPEDQRRRLAEMAAGFLSAVLLPEDERLERFRRSADALGKEARAGGWNDELDAQLLRGDFDDA